MTKRNQLPESYNLREISTFDIGKLLKKDESFSSFACYKHYLFMIENPGGSGNVVIVDVNKQCILDRIFVNKHLTGIAIDQKNKVIFVTSPKKIYHATIFDISGDLCFTFAEVNYEKRLQKPEYFNGAIALNIEDKEVYFVVKNMASKECKVIHYHDETIFLSELLSDDQPTIKRCGYDCVSYTEIVPCIHDNETCFSNIHYIQYIKHTKELVAFACVSGNAYVMTQAGIYIKTIQNLNIKILKGVYDEQSSLFVTSHIDSSKISLYHYAMQEITIIDEIDFKTSPNQRSLPLGINNVTSTIYACNLTGKFTVYSYGKIVHSLLVQCWESITQDLELYIDAKTHLTKEVIQKAQQHTSKSIYRLSTRCSFATLEPRAFVPLNISLFVNGKIPLGEIMTVPQNKKSKKRERGDTAKFTFSALNDKHSVLSNVCKRLRVPLSGMSNIDINVSSYLNMANPDSFLPQSSPFDNSWETKERLFPKPKACIWSPRCPSPTIPPMPELD